MCFQEERVGIQLPVLWLALNGSLRCTGMRVRVRERLTERESIEHELESVNIFPS